MRKVIFKLFICFIFLFCISTSNFLIFKDNNTVYKNIVEKNKNLSKVELDDSKDSEEIQLDWYSTFDVTEHDGVTSAIYFDGDLDILLISPMKIEEECDYSIYVTGDLTIHGAGSYDGVGAFELENYNIAGIYAGGKLTIGNDRYDASRFTVKSESTKPLIVNGDEGWTVFKNINISSNGDLNVLSGYYDKINFDVANIIVPNEYVKFYNCNINTNYFIANTISLSSSNVNATHIETDISAYGPSLDVDYNSSVKVDGYSDKNFGHSGIVGVIRLQSGEIISTGHVAGIDAYGFYINIRDAYNDYSHNGYVSSVGETGIILRNYYPDYENQLYLSGSNLDVVATGTNGVGILGYENTWLLASSSRSLIVNGSTYGIDVPKVTLYQRGVEIYGGISALKNYSDDNYSFESPIYFGDSKGTVTEKEEYNNEKFVYIPKSIVKEVVNDDGTVDEYYEDSLNQYNDLSSDNGVVFHSDETLYGNDYTLEVSEIEDIGRIVGYDENDDTMIKSFDINVLDNNGEVVPMSGGNFKIKIPLTDDLKGYRNYKVCYVLNGEIFETYFGRIEGDYIVFETEHLSIYTILGNNNYTLGDLNSDGQLDIIDTKLLLLETFNSHESDDLKLMDMNYDGIIDIVDVKLLLLKTFE